LDSFWRFLSYSLLLLIGLYDLFSLPINHGWRSGAKGRVWALVVVELDPFPDPNLGL